MGSKTYINIKWNWEGLHYWKDAPIGVDFLRKPHRHIFYAEAKIPVTHNDRQLEFFMVKDALKEETVRLFPETDMKGISCEMIAECFIKFLETVYGIRKGIIVSIYEDNENGATVEQ